MFGIGIPEFILILIVGLVVFGPSKLPEIGRAVGKGLREFKKASNAFQNILNAPDDEPRRTMAATHGGEKTAEELKADVVNSDTTAENKVKDSVNNDIKNSEAKTDGEESAKPAENDVVKTAEKAHGYTPPTKESVQAAIDAKQKEEKEFQNVQK